MKAFEGIDPWEKIEELKENIEKILNNVSSLENRVYYKADSEILTIALSIFYPLSFKTSPTPIRHLLEHTIGNIICGRYPIFREGPKVNPRGIFINWYSNIPKDILSKKRFENLFSEIVNIIENFEEIIENPEIERTIEYEIRRMIEERKPSYYGPYHDVLFEFGLLDKYELDSTERIKERLLEAYNKMKKRIVGILTSVEVSEDILVKVPSSRMEDILEIGKPQKPAEFGISTPNIMDLYIAIPLEYLLNFYSWNPVLKEYIFGRKLSGNIYSFYVAGGIEENMFKSVFHRRLFGRVYYQGSLEKFLENLRILENNDDLRVWEILQRLYEIYIRCKDIPLLPQHVFSIRRILRGLESKYLEKSLFDIIDMAIKEGYYGVIYPYGYRSLLRELFNL